jgi:hypothetical protein
LENNSANSCPFRMEENYFPPFSFTPTRKPLFVLGLISNRLELVALSYASSRCTQLSPRLDLFSSWPGSMSENFLCHRDGHTTLPRNDNDKLSTARRKMFFLLFSIVTHFPRRESRVLRKCAERERDERGKTRWMESGRDFSDFFFSFHAANQHLHATLDFHRRSVIKPKELATGRYRRPPPCPPAQQFAFSSSRWRRNFLISDANDKLNYVCVFLSGAFRWQPLSLSIFVFSPFQPRLAFQ